MSAVPVSEAVRIGGVPRRIVAFVDVLGFRALVETIPQCELVDVYRKLQQATDLQTARTVFPDDQRRFDSDAYYEDFELARRRVVNVVMASDSIVVYSSADTWQDAWAVLAATRGLVVAGFRNGLALRGAAAIGDLDEIEFEEDAGDPGNWTARFAGLVGLGLVRAYELESQCDWSGAILHPDLVAHLDQIEMSRHEDGVLTALETSCNIRLVVATEVPMKHERPDGGIEVVSEKHWAVNWPFLCDSADWGLTEDQVARSFTSFGRHASTGVERKRDATLAFMRGAERDAVATLEERRRTWRPGES